MPAEPTAAMLTAPLELVPGSYSYRKEALNTSCTIRFQQDEASTASDFQKGFILLWLPGSGQCPDNELLRRWVNALCRLDGSCEIESVIATAYENAENVLEQQTKLHKPIVIGGHSKGGEVAGKLAQSFNLPCIIFGNDPAHVEKTPAALVVLGEHDGGNAFLKSEGKMALESDDGIVAVLRINSTAKLLVPYGADHSLRVRPPDATDKDAFSDTPETRAMNEAVANEVRSFLRACRSK
eukprot:TRINITY_DN7497_c1_g4_i1.p1 TRINITY_DN7497_c1_g4~~TRINITY_DN7497_c1_g4_i1.p1  ORF type:complete len:239 (-),score=44.47 TRINITY_DN7497_c1_g4_i1:70-786(-)